MRAHDGADAERAAGAGPATGAETRRRAAAQVFVDDVAHPELDGDALHHLGRVLRLRAGEAVVAADGRGRWVPCRYDGRRALEPAGEAVAEVAPAPRTTVAFAPVKGERPEWVVQKLTELGVDCVVVLSTARTVVRWEGARVDAALGRLRRVATEAAAQSRRVWLPELSGVLPLDALEPAGLVLAEPGAPPLGNGVRTVAVGPEGGWTPEELAGDGGRATAGLGPHVLRAETAAVAAGVLLGAHRAGTVWPGAG